MDSVYALRLSKAINAAKVGGDFIDHGWSILKELDVAGFDVTPRETINIHRAKTLNEMCGFSKEK